MLFSVLFFFNTFFTLAFTAKRFPLDLPSSLFFSSFLLSVDIDWCHYRRSLVECEDRRSLCSAAWLSVNLWVWPSFLACARKVGVSCVQSSLITSVPRRALCHHYTLTCSIYECSGTFEYSITYMQMLWLCPRLWFIWACNRPPHTYFYLWTNPPGWARSPATLRSPEVIDYSSYSLCYEHIVWQRRSKAWMYLSVQKQINALTDAQLPTTNLTDFLWVEFCYLFFTFKID